MIGIIDPTKQMEKYIDGEIQYIGYEYLVDYDLSGFSCIFINGYESGLPKKLSYDAIQKLWHYVEAGGTLYGELINCEEFPSSRLFGFKQDFPITNHRLEKLRVAQDFQEGQLLEWQGPFLTGFTFDTEVLLEIGHFQETHRSSTKGESPGLVVKQIGNGKTIFATFSFLANEQHWTLRPYWLWNHVLEWVKEFYGLPLKAVEPPIKPSNETDIKKVIDKGINWFLNSGILPETDGSLGVYENIHSIRSDLHKDFRPDCHAHVALLFHLYGEYTRDEKWKTYANNIFTYLFDEGYQDMDENSITYGFWKWFKFPKEKPDQIFSDDNSWVALVLLYLYRKTGIEEYRRRGLLTVFAMLNTQNQNGLRPEALRERELLEKGYDYFRNSTEASMNPHFESIVHAAFIQAYLVCGEKDFLDISLKGTRYLLNNKENMKFMYSKTAGYSRLLFSLAQLYNLTKDEEIRRGLHETVDYLKKHQHEMGGIEEADNPDPERYGTEDTGVFLQNGEGIADQLYTNNFLVINGFEALKATNNPDIQDFYDRLIDYICAIQIQSTKPEYEGGWMRSFHLHKEEYFGNNGDTGWGPYVIESGWTPAIILSGLLLKELNQSLVE